MLDSKESNNQACAVRSAPAVNEDRGVFRSLDDLEDTFDLVISGSSCARHGDIEESHAEAFCLALFSLCFVALTAQIDDSFDPKVGKFFYPVFFRLSPSIKTLIDLMEIRKLLRAQLRLLGSNSQAEKHESEGYRCLVTVISVLQLFQFSVNVLKKRGIQFPIIIIQTRENW